MDPARTAGVQDAVDRGHGLCGAPGRPDSRAWARATRVTGGGIRSPGLVGQGVSRVGAPCRCQRN